MKANQRPTYSANIPKSLRGDGADAIALASAFFGDPLPWQEHICRIMLARDKQDKYAAKVFAMSVPRQNGKSWSVRARCFYGLVACGEKILFTCQHGDTADEMFKDLSEVFEDEENVELHELLKAVRKTNGQQAIYLNNGGCVRFTTRTNSLARGKTYDVLIYDEAQELTVAQQAASLPTISAGNLKNPQTIYLGTPPDPECSGTVFKEMHDRVHAGVSDAAWVEWSVSEIGNVSDRRRWERSNPSYGILLSPDAIAAQREDICVAAEDCIESNRESMRQIALMAMAVANNTGIDGLTDEQRSVMPHFKSPSMASLAATADAMTKVAGSLEGFAQTDVFLEGMGFDASEVERIRSQIEANGNRAALMQIMGGGGN